MIRYFVLTITLLFAASTYAADGSSQNADSIFKKNIWGAGFGLSLGINNLSSDDDGSLTAGSLFYEYRFDENYSFNTKFYTAGSGNNREAEFDLTGLQLTFKAQTGFTDHLSGYARAGANIYDTKLTRGGNDNNSGGVGFVIATGLEYDFGNNFKAGFETEFFTAGDADSLGANLFIGYSF